MVEAIPLSSESIMLVITKIEDPEELDTRFAKFSPFTDDNQNSLVSQLASEFLEGAPDSLNYLEPGSVEQVGDESGTGSASEAPAKKNTGSVASSRISGSTVWTASARLPGPYPESMTASTPCIKSPAPDSIISL